MIAIVGKVASGKTTFINKLRELNFRVFVCDEYVNYLYENDHNLQSKFLDIFGARILKDNKIDKKYLKSKISLKQNLLKEVEKIVFPLVFEKLKNKEYDFVEIPVLNTEVVDFVVLFSSIWNLVVDSENYQKFLKKRNVDNFLKSQFIQKKPYFFDEINVFRGVDIVNISLENRLTTKSIKEFLRNQKINI